MEEFTANVTSAKHLKAKTFTVLEKNQNFNTKSFYLLTKRPNIPFGETPSTARLHPEVELIQRHRVMEL